LKITVKYFLEYARLSGCREEELLFENDELVSAKEVFKNLNSKYKIKYEDVINKGIILVNNRSITQLNMENTVLRDRDKLTLMPMISGG
jgi:molybdopterin converting factor small subunit